MLRWSPQQFYKFIINPLSKRISVSTRGCLTWELALKCITCSVFAQRIYTKHYSHMWWSWDWSCHTWRCQCVTNQCLYSQKYLQWPWQNIHLIAVKILSYRLPRNTAHMLMVHFKWLEVPVKHYHRFCVCV